MPAMGSPRVTESLDLRPGRRVLDRLVKDPIVDCSARLLDLHDRDKSVGGIVSKPDRDVLAGQGLGHLVMCVTNAEGQASAGAETAAASERVGQGGVRVLGP